MSAAREDERALVPVMLGLTVVTGIIDAASFLGLGRIFTANMTGNIVLFGFALAGVQGLSVSRSGLALIGFIAGSVFGARLMKPERRASRQLALAMGVELALLVVATAASLGTDGDLSSVPLYAVIACTAAAMGVRSAAVRRIAVPDMTTTVLTLTLAGLAADVGLVGGHAVRMGRRVLSIIAMATGAFAGAVLLDRVSLAAPLAVSAVIVGALELVLRARSDR